MQIDALLQYMHGGNDTEMDDTKVDAHNLHHETQQVDGELQIDDEMDAQTLHHEIHDGTREIEIAAEIETDDEMDQLMKNPHHHDTRQGDH